MTIYSDKLDRHTAGSFLQYLSIECVLLSCQASTTTPEPTLGYVPRPSYSTIDARVRLPWILKSGWLWLLCRGGQCIATLCSGSRHVHCCGVRAYLKYASKLCMLAFLCGETDLCCVCVVLWCVVSCVFFVRVRVPCVLCGVVLCRVVACRAHA